MSRDWLALYVAILGKPKYRKLSIPARAGLFHIWLLAPGQAPEATWRSRDDLVEMLELDGYPPALLDELITRGWIDIESDGVLAVHDWDVHQFGATKAIRDYWEAERKRKWRREQKSPPEPPSTDTGTGTSTAQGQDRTGSGLRPDASGRVRTRADGVSTSETNGRDPSTCPRCGDGPLDDKDANVIVVSPAGHLAHRTCPTNLVATTSPRKGTA